MLVPPVDAGPGPTGGSSRSGVDPRNDSAAKAHASVPQADAGGNAVSGDTVRAAPFAPLEASAARQTEQVRGRTTAKSLGMAVGRSVDECVLCDIG